MTYKRWQRKHWHIRVRQGQDVSVTQTAPDDWSPADNPYAIAVSEAQWWKHAVTLTVSRIRDDDHHLPVFGFGFSSRQIDARYLVVALRQLLTAAELEKTALKELGIDGAVGAALHQAQQRFEAALPGIKHMRDGLVHFENWSRGDGFGPQRQLKDTGEDPRDIARKFSGFGYDPRTGTVSLGSTDPVGDRPNQYSIDIDKVETAAEDLTCAIYLAAREVDKKNRAALAPGTSEH